MIASTGRSRGSAKAELGFLYGWGAVRRPTRSVERFVRREECRKIRNEHQRGTQTVACAAENFSDLFSIAPMMDVTDQHFNRFARSISRRATLWTEMVVDRTVIHNQERIKNRLSLSEDGRMNPIVFQLGGSEPEYLFQAASLIAPLGYNEINLNCGCPSDKVSGKGCFGAALMKNPALVAECTAKMSEASKGKIPVSVKCRLGVDDLDSYENLAEFVRTVSEKGNVQHFVIHARKALLKGLSPAQNRSIPPLKYEYVYRLIRDFPHLVFTINGGIQNLSSAEEHLRQGVHGVMLGRAARDKIWDVLAEVDTKLYGDVSCGCTRRQVVRDYARYADKVLETTSLSYVVLLRPIMGAFHGEKGARLFRGSVSELARTKSMSDAVEESFRYLQDECLDRTPGTPKPDFSVLQSATA